MRVGWLGLLLVSSAVAAPNRSPAHLELGRAGPLLAGQITAARPPGLVATHDPDRYELTLDDVRFTMVAF